MTTRNRVWRRSQVNTRRTRYHNSVNQKHTTSSGRKYTTAHGITAIRDGMPQSRQRRLLDVAEIHTTDRKPPWFRVRLSTNQKLARGSISVIGHGYRRVRRSSLPQIRRMLDHGLQPSMLMGSVCTRVLFDSVFCRYRWNPKGMAVDHENPQKSRCCAVELQPRYVVLTLRSKSRRSRQMARGDICAACINAMS